MDWVEWLELVLAAAAVIEASIALAPMIYFQYVDNWSKNPYVFLRSPAPAYRTSSQSHRYGVSLTIRNRTSQAVDFTFMWGGADERGVVQGFRDPRVQYLPSSVEMSTDRLSVPGRGGRSFHISVEIVGEEWRPTYLLSLMDERGRAYHVEGAVANPPPKPTEGPPGPEP